LEAAELSLDLHGAQHLPRLAVPVLEKLAALSERVPGDRAGTRIIGDPGLTEIVAPEGPVGRAIAALSTSELRPVRAILFDKNDEVNWSLGWHQDRTVAVQQRHEVAGYGPWTVKQGILHVQPPFEVIARMMTVRIHLDAVDGDNAPLRVALGSHRIGHVPVDEIEEAVRQSGVFSCLAEAGDVWVYSTPILHASDAAASGRRRRVLQIDYASEALPNPLAWLGI
jgi:hypothetical protein